MTRRLTPSVLALLALLSTACGQVVGADCAGDRVLCGDVCCPVGLDCDNGLCVGAPADGGADAGPAGDAGDACAPTEIACGDECVDPATDDDHCGACGVECGPDADCVMGACVAECDADELLCAEGCVDPTTDDDNCGACGTICAGDEDCVDGACLPEACDLGTTLCGGVCVDTRSDAANCGACDVACGVGEVCDDGVCSAVCTTPRLVCGGACVDPSVNADNCGACGTRCESNTCRGGVCLDARFGHIVVVGHDYSDVRQGMNRVLGTAALIPLEREVDVLAYEGSTETAAAAGVRAAIDQVAISTDRQVDYDVATLAEVPVRLGAYDVLVVHSQHMGDDATLRSTGFAWRAALRTFLRRGGVLVVLDAGGAHGGTHQILETAGLASFRARTTRLGDTQLRVVDGADAVAREVPVSYRAEERTASFDPRSPAGGVVVATDDAAADPVVLHWLIAP